MQVKCRLELQAGEGEEAASEAPDGLKTRQCTQMVRYATAASQHERRSMTPPE